MRHLALALALAAALVALPAAAQTVTIPQANSCVVLGVGSCAFDCNTLFPTFMFGYGLPGATFTVTCAGKSASCSTSALSAVCGIDFTGVGPLLGAGSCTAAGPAVAMHCGTLSGPLA